MTEKHTSSQGLQLTIASIMVLLFSLNSHASNQYEGCYTQTDIVHDQSSGKQSTVTSWVYIFKNNDHTYGIKGEIYGGNYHVCHILPEEGDQLILHEQQNRLHFRYEQKEYDLSCHLVISRNENMIHIKDEGFGCTRYFACGVRASVHDISLPYLAEQCPTTEK